MQFATIWRCDATPERLQQDTLIGGGGGGSCKERRHSYVPSENYMNKDLGRLWEAIF